MPSAPVAKNRYRKAKCCATCSHEDKRYCSILLTRVQPDFVCDRHSEDSLKASVKVQCVNCRWGVSGDRSCSYGCAPEHSGWACFFGRQIKEMP